MVGIRVARNSPVLLIKIELPPLQAIASIRCFPVCLFYWLSLLRVVLRRTRRAGSTHSRGDSESRQNPSLQCKPCDEEGEKYPQFEHLAASHQSLAGITKSLAICAWASCIDCFAANQGGSLTTLVGIHFPPVYSDRFLDDHLTSNYSQETKAKWRKGRDLRRFLEVVRGAD